MKREAQAIPFKTKMKYLLFMSAKEKYNKDVEEAFDKFFKSGNREVFLLREKAAHDDFLNVLRAMKWNPVIK